MSSRESITMGGRSCGSSSRDAISVALSGSTHIYDPSSIGIGIGWGRSIIMRLRQLRGVSVPLGMGCSEAPSALASV
jgi:hypothetical protein